MATKKSAVSKGITVTKADANSFTVRFPQAVGPGNFGPGSNVPVEWLRAALDYYVQHRQDDGSLTSASLEKVKPLW